MNRITHKPSNATELQRTARQLSAVDYVAAVSDSAQNPGFVEPLGNTDEIRVPPPSRRIASARFVQHLEMREVVRRVTHQHRVCNCGWKQIEADKPVLVGRRSDLGRVSFTNTRYCGSVWICPTCGAIVQSRRIAELTSAMERRPDLGVIHCVPTLQHSRGDELAPNIDDLLESWRFVTSGAPAKRWKERNGIIGFVKVLELRWSAKNGWHPHLHIAIAHRFGAANAEDVESFIRRRYGDHLKRRGGYVSQYHGLKFRTDSKKLSNYFDKLQDEAGSYSAAPLKELMTIYKSSEESLHPFDLARLAQAGDKNAAALWAEYVKATKGKAWMTVSPALRVELGLGEELPDDEVMAEEMTHYAQLIAIHQDAWRELRWNRDFIPALAAAALAIDHPRDLVRWLVQECGEGRRYDLNGKDDAPRWRSLSWCWVVDAVTEELPAADGVP